MSTDYEKKMPHGISHHLFVTPALGESQLPSDTETTRHVCATQTYKEKTCAQENKNKNIFAGRSEHSMYT